MVKYIYGTKYCYRIKIKRKTIDISARFLFSELKSRINNVNKTQQKNLCHKNEIKTQKNNI